MKIKFKDLFRLNNQLQNFTEKTPCWFELSRNKIRTQRIVEPIMKEYSEDRNIIINEFGIKDETGNFKLKKALNEKGIEIDVYDFGDNNKIANEKLESLAIEQDEKEYDIDLLIPSKENVESTLKLSLSSYNIEYITEYIFTV